jgi:hypothetical protein
MTLTRGTAATIVVMVWTMTTVGWRETFVPLGGASLAPWGELELFGLRDRPGDDIIRHNPEGVEYISRERSSRKGNARCGHVP